MSLAFPHNALWPNRHPLFFAVEGLCLRDPLSLSSESKEVTGRNLCCWKALSQLCTTGRLRGQSPACPSSCPPCPPPPSVMMGAGAGAEQEQGRIRIRNRNRAGQELGWPCIGLQADAKGFWGLPGEMWSHASGHLCWAEHWLEIASLCWNQNYIEINK